MEREVIEYRYTLSPLISDIGGEKEYGYKPMIVRQSMMKLWFFWVATKRKAFVRDRNQHFSDACFGDKHDYSMHFPKDLQNPHHLCRRPAWPIEFFRFTPKRFRGITHRPPDHYERITLIQGAGQPNDAYAGYTGIVAESSSNGVFIRGEASTLVCPHRGPFRQNYHGTRLYHLADDTTKTTYRF